MFKRKKKNRKCCSMVHYWKYLYMKMNVEAPYILCILCNIPMLLLYFTKIGLLILLQYIQSPVVASSVLVFKKTPVGMWLFCFTCLQVSSDHKNYFISNYFLKKFPLFFVTALQKLMTIEALRTLTGVFFLEPASECRYSPGKPLSRAAPANDIFGGGG